MDAVIFTEAIAKELINKGFKLLYKTEKAWHFEDSVLLWCAANKLFIQEQDKRR